jgi:hypothetical protein
VGAGADALKVAIDEAWRVFDMPAPATTGVCEHCCMWPEIEADFLKMDARDLPANYVRDWYFAAFADGINHDHIAWFLPRVMEMLAAGEEVASVGNDIAFQRLPRTGFPGAWDRSEVLAVQRFANAFFAALLSGEVPDTAPEIDRWLCTFGIGGVDVRPLLALLDDLTDDRLIEVLHREWIHPYAHFVGVSAFWEDSLVRKEVWDWFTSRALLERMEEAAMAGNEKALDIYGVIAEARAR